MSTKTSARPLLRALRDPQTRLVWACVCFGGLGAEAFGISIVFYFVQSSGLTGAFYLVPQLAAGCVSGLLGNALLDRFAPLRVTLYAEVLRIAAALTAFVTVVANGPIWIVIMQAVLIVAVRPHHDAGVMSGLSRMGLKTDRLRAMSSLVDNTFRVARILGPAVAAGLAVIAGSSSVIAFSAGMFAVALVLFIRLDRQSASVKDSIGSSLDQISLKESLRRGFHLVRRSRFLTYCYITQMLNAGAWYLGFVFSVALILSDQTGSDDGLGRFGIATLCYGLGNVAAGVFVATRPIAEPWRYMMAARCLAGVGYLFMAANSDLWWLCVFAVIAATGTPPADLTFIKVAQGNYQWADVAKLYRLKLIAEYTGMLVAISCAPALIGAVGGRGAIAVCGGVLVSAAVAGFILVRMPRRDVTIGVST